MKERIVISRSLPISLYPSLELESWDSLMLSRRYIVVVGIRRGDEGTGINGRGGRSLVLIFNILPGIRSRQTNVESFVILLRDAQNIYYSLGVLLFTHTHTQAGLIEGIVIMTVVGAIRSVLSWQWLRMYLPVIRWQIIWFFSFHLSRPFPPLPHTHSVKAMLLLIDCKDRIILQTSISSVLNGVEKGRKKLSNGVSSSTSCV